MGLCPSRGAAALAAILVLVGSSISRATEPPPFSRRNPITQAVQKTKAAIVTVQVPRPGGGKDLVGTGVVVDERGIIVTNCHVVGACKEPKVRLHDGTVVTAEVVFAEARWDLAALRIRTEPTFQALPLADSDDLMVGETVIAIGHPYGYTNTVSTGIVSALGREIDMNGETLTGLIQTDASINPGNSGGPLLNINGELIGINCALRSEAQGIAFAIPAGTVKTVLQKFMSAERISGVNHGLVCRDKILGETGDRQRVVVASFPGDGLKAGDAIRAVGAQTVRNSFDVERALWDSKPGDTVKLKVDRQGKALVVELTLAASHGAGATAASATTEAQPIAATPTARVVGASAR
jgi:serine protease Do